MSKKITLLNPLQSKFQYIPLEMGKEKICVLTLSIFSLLTDFVWRTNPGSPGKMSASHEDVIESISYSHFVGIGGNPIEKF